MCRYIHIHFHTHTQTQTFMGPYIFFYAHTDIYGSFFVFPHTHTHTLRHL